MILNFLQTRDPPVLPCLHKLPDRSIDPATGQPSLSSFADDLDKLRGFGAKNKETLGQLLFSFFRLYGHEVDYDRFCVSVRQGSRIKREEKNWQPGAGTKEGGNRLCVEEPFSTDRNLGNSADDYAWHGIHTEIRRAFDLLADGQQLDKACEQFEFPLPEQSDAQTNSLFKKPQSQKATLTSSAPARGGRGGSNHRGGGRVGFGARNNNATGRRASGSNSFTHGRPPFIHSPPIPTSAGPEYFSFPRGLHHDQLHDQLASQYQMLEMQSNNLRAQLAAQQHAEQAHQVHAAQMHAHAVAQAQAQGRGHNGMNASPQKSPYANGRPSPRLAELGIPPNALPQGFLYHYPGFFHQALNPVQLPDAGSQDGARTNPSSPSMGNSIPIRARLHRPSNASDAGSLRSHSQPPRGLAPQQMPAGYSVVPQIMNQPSYADPVIARSSPQDIPNLQSTSATQRTPPSNPPEPVRNDARAAPPEHSTPKEHVPVSLADYAIKQAIPTWSELTQRRRRPSPETTQPLAPAQRRVSRSPSPLGGHVRSYSIQVPLENGQQKARVDTMRPPMDNGPVIVNGSFPDPSHEPRIREDKLDAYHPDLSNASALGIFTNTHAMHQINELQARQQSVLQEMLRQKAAAENMAPQVVNGSKGSSPSIEANGLTRVQSGGQQPFPHLPESWSSFEAMSGHHSGRGEESPPKRSLPPQWRTPAYANGLPSLDTSNAPRGHPQEVQSATLPLLSPVFETRTPSPTASRSNDLGKLVNGVKAQAKGDGQQNRRASHTPQSNGVKDNRNGQPKGKAQAHENGSKSAGPMGLGTWQQPKNGRKNKSSKKKGAEQKSSGEPLPTNSAERKGG
jgi:hypothetical protein